MTPYQRELRLMPHILRMEQRGIPLDIALLENDYNFYFSKLDELDQSICEIVGKEIDIDSNNDLADAIERAGLSKGFKSTPTGKRSTAKDSLIDACADPTLLGKLLVRGALATCLRTFMQPWLKQAQSHGRLYIRWNQIRNYSDTGARTGRLSSSPNLQNIPVLWEGLLKQLNMIGYELEFPLPIVRKYIVPEDGYVFIGRDYKAQELRLLAHFTSGILLETIKSNPDADVHLVAAEIAKISRREAKTMAFAIIYGAGVGRIAESLAITVKEATDVKARYLAAIPEIKRFTRELTEQSRSGQPVVTLAGRQYHTQAPALVMGVMRSFEYKLPNFKIQGSAADQTKEAMYRYATGTRDGMLALSVHDQLVAQVPKESVEAERKILDDAVNGSFQDVLKYKVTSDEAIGTNFAELK
jgi:DNA polymerase-1